MALRLTIIDKRNESRRKEIFISPSISLDDLLNICSRELKLTAKLLFLPDGGQIDDPEMLRSGDEVYVSRGEAMFHRSGGEEKGNTMASGSLPTYSVAVMGSGAVGKSALTLRFIKGLFVPTYDPTIEDAYRKPVSVEGKTCMLEVLDTAGQDDFAALRSTWLREKDGVIFVFDITNIDSFRAMLEFINELNNIYDKVPPTLLVGNKCDLDKRRQVTAAQAAALVESFSMSGYVETSALSGQGVENAFATLVKRIRTFQGKGSSDGDSCSSSSNSGKQKQKLLHKLCTIL